ncbi:restriction endonuclease subunit S [Brachyspira aalborgi]|uniref:Restriction endonuclease subunit S n=1 Tax=Brachyspira aalborgi TaxID=29522 RepID=A0A5C8FQI8_9SPIR|nr:restriction endonuclease subunit S [Brachyspira aalborgi]TXJ51835.1 restriction endonuclease subunit S [Brachyspira aalborgi]
MNKINKDWKEVKLGDIGVFLRGFGISKKDLSDSGTPAIRYGDIYTKYDFIIKNISSFTNSKGTELKKGDILFAGSGETIAEIGKSVAFIDDFKALAGGDIIIFRPSIELDSAFLSYMLNTGKCRRDISVMGQGVIIAHISSKSLQKLSVFLPSLDEQKRIASALSKIDAYLENTIKLIEEKERFKRGIAKKLLTCKEGENIPEARFKGFEDEWMEVAISKIGTIITGNTPSTKNESFWNGNNVWVTPTDIKQKYIYNSERKLTDDGLKKSRKLPANTLLITCIASIGKNAILKCEGACNQQINTIIPNKNYNVDFLYYLFENEKSYLKFKAPQSVIKIMSKSEFSKLVFKFPLLEEQEKIGGYLSLLDEEIDNLKKQKELIKEMKIGAMEKLLSGEVRLLE